jgi:chromosome segregation ATPase
VSQELEGRSRENEHLVSLLEDQEQKIALYEQKEKAVQQLAAESKKRIEESNAERDKVLLKEQQYLRQIARLEERVKTEGQERQERHDKIVESLRLKHKSSLDQRDDEISDLRLKLSDAKEKADRHRMERDSLRNELNKLHDQVRTLKDEASMKYESYNKQLN